MLSIPLKDRNIQLTDSFNKVLGFAINTDDKVVIHNFKSLITSKSIEYNNAIHYNYLLEDGFINLNDKGFVSIDPELVQVLKAYQLECEIRSKQEKLKRANNLINRDLKYIVDRVMKIGKTIATFKRCRVSGLYYYIVKNDQGLDILGRSKNSYNDAKRSSNGSRKRDLTLCYKLGDKINVWKSHTKGLYFVVDKITDTKITFTNPFDKLQYFTLPRMVETRRAGLSTIRGKIIFKFSDKDMVRSRYMFYINCDDLRFIRDTGSHSCVHMQRYLK